MDLFDEAGPTRRSPYRFHIFAGFTALAAFSLIYGPGTHTTTAQPTRDPMTLIASPNDPLMIQAIKYAQGAGRKGSNGGVWNKPKTDGLTATFTTPAGSITLSRAEIAEANFVYPQLKQRARDGHHYSHGGGSADDGFSTGDNAGEWSDQSQ